MKRIILLLVLAFMLAGCDDVFQQDETGNSPFLKGVETARAVNAVSVPVNPYAGLIEIGLGLVTIAAGGCYIKKRSELGVVAKKYQSHKVAVSDIMKEMTPEEQALLYEKIGSLRKKVGL
jgi:hypothetical protein